MTLQLLTGQGITYPDDIGALSLSPSLSGSTIDSTGEKVAICGSVFTPSRGTKSIRKIHFRFGSVTKAGGSGLTVSLQNLLTSAGSGPVPDETQDETVAIANGDAGFTSNAWYTTGALSADRSVTHGERLAVVIEYDGSGRLGSDSVVISGMLLTGGDAKFGFPSVALKTASWSVTVATIPNVIFEFSDGTFGTFAGAYPHSAINSHSYKQDTAGADEYAMKLTLPFSCKTDGAIVRVNSGTTADYDIILYEGTTALATVSIDGNEVAGVPSRPLRVQWSSEISLAAGTVYRLAAKPTQTTANVVVYSTDVAAANHFTCLQGGPEMCHSTRLDLGSWSDTATRRLIGFGLSLSSIDDGAGGGGSRMVNVRGGADQ